MNAEKVRIAAALWQIHGHHRVTIELARAGDSQGSAIHARHPLDEIVPLVRAEVVEQVGQEGGRIAADLDAATEAVVDAATMGDVAAISSAVARTREVVEEATNALGGNEDAFTGSVVVALLEAVAHEYEEAVTDGTVRMPVEFQDAYGFLVVAGELHDRVAPGIEAEEPKEAEEIEEGFQVLGRALPGPRPPRRPVPPREVQAAVSLIAHELEETVGALVADKADPDAVWEEIDRLLGEIEAAYRKGETGKAAELAAQAYLENYELVEADVIELAPEINEELEPLLGADLRAKIQEGVAVSELESMIERARTLLARAREAVRQTGGEAVETIRVDE